MAWGVCRRGCGRLRPRPTNARAGIALFVGCWRRPLAVDRPALAAPRASALLRRFVGLKHRVARVLRCLLELRPPVYERHRHFAAFTAQHEEIICGAKPRMLEEASGPDACTLLEARLQRPDLLDRRFESPRNCNALGLRAQH